MKFWRDDKTFELDTLLTGVSECSFANHGEVLPNGGIIYELQDGLSNNPHPIIVEAIPDGRTDWGHRGIYNQGERFVHQCMTESGSFLTYSMEEDNGFCGIFLNEKDTNGNWQKSPNILPLDKDCQGPWFTCISPDGTKIVWLKFTRDESMQPTKGDIMISSRLANGKWSKPAILVENFGLSQQRKQLKSMRLSNTNLTFALWHGPAYLYTSLDKNGTLHQIK